MAIIIKLVNGGPFMCNGMLFEPEIEKQVDDEQLARYLAIQTVYDRRGNIARRFRVTGLDVLPPPIEIPAPAPEPDPNEDLIVETADQLRAKQEAARIGKGRKRSPAAGGDATLDDLREGQSGV